jgi:hypothetical protein
MQSGEENGGEEGGEAAIERTTVLERSSNMIKS